MKDTALYFLYRVAFRKIPHNQFAKAIYNRFKNAGEVVDLESWELLEIPFDEKTVLEENDPIRIERNKDYRFLYLYLKAFRKFPAPSYGGYYGVSFCSGKKNAPIPESALFQGGNGTGKTSLFGAMEYLFTGKMSAANKHGYKGQASLSDFIPFAGEKSEGSDINVVTQTLLFSLNSDNSQQKDFLRLCLLPFFCSEYDVDRIVEKGVNGFVDEQMGYTLTKEIIGKLEDELKNVSKQYESLEEKSIEHIESLIGDLDKKVVMYENLKPSFMSIAAKLNNEAKSKPTLNELRSFLSKKFVQKEEDSFFENEKLLSKDNLIAEKSFISKALGRNTASDFLLQMYIKILRALNRKSKKADDLLILSLVKKESLIQILEEFNYARECFLSCINEILDKDVIPDITSCVKQYEVYLQRHSVILQQAEARRQKMIKVINIMANRAIYDEFLDAYKNEVYDTLNNLTNGSRDLVNEVMKMFAMDDEEIMMDFDGKSGDFNVNIVFRREDGKKITLSPMKYLNTFRFKLFCMTLKMSIAFAMKKFYKINFPIVIDDVFYSSDFAHRSMVKDFFWVLFKKHKELFENIDLQVIFFTHDDVVVEAAYRGVCDVVGCSGVDRKIMYDYRECGNFEEITLPFYSHEGDPEVIKMKKLAYS